MAFKEDIARLDAGFMRKQNEITVIYGERENGLTDLLMQFNKDKEGFYFCARKCDYITQMRVFINELYSSAKLSSPKSADIASVLSEYIKSTPAKKVIIIDNFNYIIKESPSFLNMLCEVRSHLCPDNSCLFLLASDDIYFVRNNLVKTARRSSYEISEIYRVCERSLRSVYAEQRGISVSEYIGMVSVIGLNKMFWDDAKECGNTRSLIVSYMLDTTGRYIEHMSSLFGNYVREPAVYNTILYNIAGDKNKLNDIHASTGYDRAKLSVYIKNLIAMGILYKAEGVPIGDEHAVKSGVYYFIDPGVHFYYRFIFPNLSALYMLSRERFYRKYIENGLHMHIEHYYSLFCIEQLRYLNENQKLPFSISHIEKYYDKREAIDIVAWDDEGNIIICGCRYRAPHMSYSQYEDIVKSAESAKLDFKAIYLFSADDFDQKLSLNSKMHKELVLINGKGQRLR